jgi:hypothetical protein
MAKEDNPAFKVQLRPISILPALSKVVEKIVPHDITDFIEKHVVINNKVTGFHKCHITAPLRIKGDIYPRNEKT